MSRYFGPGARSVRRRHCVGGGAPVNFGRRRWRAAGPKKSAAARAAKNIFSKFPDKISFYPQHFLMTFFKQNNYEATMATIAAAPTNCRRRVRRTPLVRRRCHCRCVLILLQFSMTKKGHQKILRIERNFFGNF